MSDTTNAENARTAREAQDAIVSRPRGSSGGAIDAAMRRYLSAEQYDELRKHREESVEDAEDAGSG